MISVVAAFFRVMGVTALVRPRFVSGFFGLPEIPGATANEALAVCGGFGPAIAGALGAVPRLPSLGPGIVLTVALALSGTAPGRLVGFA